jgi:PhoPQ-activated pathogenicity-related protein
MPILFVNGTNDFAYPLDSYMKSFDSVPGPKQLCVTVNMPHGHIAGWAPSEIGLFVDQHLLETEPLPVLSEVVVDGVVVSLRWEGPLKVAKAGVHHTTDKGEINQRTWISTAATIDGQNVRAAAPPDNATAWFLTVEDERGAIVSSRVMLTGVRR